MELRGGGTSWGFEIGAPPRYEPSEMAKNGPKWRILADLSPRALDRPEMSESGLFLGPLEEPYHEGMGRFWGSKRGRKSPKIVDFADLDTISTPTRPNLASIRDPWTSSFTTV